jgi:hypothetical protein
MTPLVNRVGKTAGEALTKRSGAIGKSLKIKSNLTLIICDGRRMKSG